MCNVKKEFNLEDVDGNKITIKVKCVGEQEHVVTPTGTRHTGYYNVFGNYATKFRW